MKKKNFLIFLLIILIISACIGLMVLDKKWGLKKLWQSRFSEGKTVIILDAGHGGYDPGCGEENPYEKDITMKIVKQVQKDLEKKDIVVILTREDDTFISLGDRVLCTRIYNGDLFVSVHLNWAENKDAYGIETYCNEKLNKKSILLAKAVQKSVLKATNSHNRDVHSDSEFYVVRNSAVPSCLVEVGFLSSKTEGSKLREEEYQKKIATGITKGIEAYIEAVSKE